MSTVKDVERLFLAELPPNIDRQTLDPEEDLMAQGLIDSLGLMKLVASFETTFNIKVDDEDIVPENFQTLNAMTLLVESKRQK